MATNASTNFESTSTVSITLAGVTAGNARQSAEFFGALHSAGVLDAHLDVDITGGATGDGLVSVYAYARSSAAAGYTDSASGSDATFVTADRRNSVLLGTIQMNNTSAVKAGPFSIASAFGGFIPAQGGIIVINDSDATLASATVRVTGLDVQA